MTDDSTHVQGTPAEHQKHRPETLAKRQEILRAASEVFGMKGSSKGTLEEIAHKVGMTRAGILHHFGSKRGLLLAVLQFRDTSAVADLESHHMPGGGGLFRHLIDTVRRNEQRPGIVYTFVTLSAESITEDNPGHDYFLQRYTNLRNEITEALISMARERRTTIDMNKAIMASSAILAVMDGLQLQWLVDGQKLDLSASTEYAIDTIVASVIPDAAEPA
ncbi:MAG: TetR/AcrR family transcriptional regulator [Bifidobacterium sp.]|uniref:TetR/AcrR family transcriptional regulator n=1 Tax=Bifidobacterium sp. TaxID=41200 RepID=UPI0039E8C540